MSQIIAKVYDTDSALLGPGPLYHIVDPEVTEILDNPGDVTFSVPAGDDRSASTIGASTARTVELVYLAPNGIAAAVVGTGSIRGGSSSLEFRPDGQYIRYRLPQTLGELAWATTCPQHDYDGVALSAMLENEIGALKGLLSSSWGAVGWSLGTCSPDKTEIFEFNGETVLTAIRHMAEDVGTSTPYHFRETPGTARSLDFGTFGTDSGVRVHQALVAAESWHENTRALVISGNMRKAEDRSQIVNWMIPLAANREDATPEIRLSLEFCSLSSPYTVGTMTDPNGNTRYYITDATSAAAYGERREVWFRNDIRAASEDPTELEENANILYYRAVARMLAYKDPITTYSCEVIDPSGQAAGAFGVGDKVRLVFEGMVWRRDAPVSYESIDALYMVTKRTSRWSRDGVRRMSLDLSATGTAGLTNTNVLRGMNSHLHWLWRTKK